MEGLAPLHRVDQAESASLTASLTHVTCLISRVQLAELSG
jgi:hypothetical protein